MPRRLTIQRTTVPNSEREKYFERLKAAKAHYESANCRFWVFEESALRGAFVEFNRSGRRDRFGECTGNSAPQDFRSGRIYHELEIGTNARSKD
jgi:hypothetical protein